jgi:hypothetical protein
MKRDMELIRLLLVQHETDEMPPELEKYSTDDVLYNYRLMADAGLIEASFVDGEGVIPAAINYIRLTWAGHDFLDATKDSKIWKMAKDHIIKPGASWTFSILVEWLKLEARRRVFGDQTSSCDSTPPHVV